MTKVKVKLRRKIDYHLKKLGFVKIADGSFELPSSEKEIIRGLHSEQRIERLKSNKAFINTNFSKLLKYFASGGKFWTGSVTINKKARK